MCCTSLLCVTHLLLRFHRSGSVSTGRRSSGGGRTTPERRPRAHSAFARPRRHLNGAGPVGWIPFASELRTSGFIKGQQRARAFRAFTGTRGEIKISNIWTVESTALGPNQSLICCLPSEICTVRLLKVIKVDELVLMDHHLC